VDGAGKVRLAAVLAAVILLTQSLIDLELAVDLGEWHLNAPVADLVALALLPLAAAEWLRDRTPLPGWAGYLVFLVASALSLYDAILPAEGLHHLLRKPVFLYLAYGLGLGFVIARARSLSLFLSALVLWATSTAALSLLSSVGRIASGEALWFHAIAGITPNHKTLAVCLAAGLPLLLAIARQGSSAPWARRLAQMSLMLAILAIGLSASKTAWLTTLVALGLTWPAHRPLSLRPKVVLPTVVLGLVLAYYVPVFMGSKTMLDAARSRHSLNERSWEMFRAAPLVGSGTGMNVHYEMVTFPHYRVNGVDAHGVFQKVGSETGLVGLVGYGAFVAATGLAIARRRREDDPLRDAALGTWICLHVNLLLSTETLSSTHWVPLAVAWGLSLRADTRTPDEAPPAEAPCAS